MLKRRDSPYVAGRPKGRGTSGSGAPLTLDCVLMYAQRGSGKRSSYYSDYTFGAWREASEPSVSWCRSARRTSGSRTRSCSSSIAGYATTPSRASAPCERSHPSWCSRWPSTRCRCLRGTSQALRCAFHASTASDGISRRTRRIASNACRDDPEVTRQQTPPRRPSPPHNQMSKKADMASLPADRARELAPRGRWSRTALPLPPAVRAWFAGRGWELRGHQAALLQKAAQRRSCLLIAPTGSGKTLAGFLPSLVDLSRRERVTRDRCTPSTSPR